MNKYSYNRLLRVNNTFPNNVHTIIIQVTLNKMEVSLSYTRGFFSKTIIKHQLFLKKF